MADVTDRDQEQAHGLLAEMKTEPDSTGKEAVLAEALAQARESAFQMGYAEAAAGWAGTLRVLRVIEYVYPDAEAMIRDMANWGVQGLAKFGKTWVRSTTLSPEVQE